MFAQRFAQARYRAKGEGFVALRNHAASKYATASAQDASLASGGSARDVKRIGTDAPSTIPGVIAPQKCTISLYSMLPASIVGTSRISGSPQTGDSIPLIRAASAESALSNAKGPSTIAPVISPSAIQVAQRLRVEGRRHCRVHVLGCRQDRDLRHCDAERVRERDRILEDRTFRFQCWRDVERGVRHQERLRINMLR